MPPLRQTQKPVLLLVGAGHWPARRPRTSYHLLGKARRGCGTAPTTILEQPGPSGPEGYANATQILRAGNIAKPNRYASLVMGVRGAATWSTGTVLLGANPGGVLVTLPPWAKSLAARRRRNIPLRTTNPIRNLSPHPPRIRSAPSPQGEGLKRSGRRNSLRKQPQLRTAFTQSSTQHSQIQREAKRSFAQSSFSYFSFKKSRSGSLGAPPAVAVQNFNAFKEQKGVFP